MPGDITRRMDAPRTQGGRDRFCLRLAGPYRRVSFPLACLALLSLTLPAWCQAVGTPGTSDASLPPAPEIMGGLHRGPSGDIVGTAPGTAPASRRNVAPTKPQEVETRQSAIRSSIRTRAPIATREAPPPAPPTERTAIEPTPASGADAWDRISCRTIAWQPNLQMDTCLQALKSARARLAAMGRPKSSAKARSARGTGVE